MLRQYKFEWLTKEELFDMNVIWKDYLRPLFINIKNNISLYDTLYVDFKLSDYLSLTDLNHWCTPKESSDHYGKMWTVISMLMFYTDLDESVKAFVDRYKNYIDWVAISEDIKVSFLISNGNIMYTSRSAFIIQYKDMIHWGNMSYIMLENALKSNALNSDLISYIEENNSVKKHNPYNVIEC